MNNIHFLFWRRTAPLLLVLSTLKKEKFEVFKNDLKRDIIFNVLFQIIEEKKQLIRVEDHNHNVQALADNKNDTEDRKPKIFIDRLLAETRGGVPFSDQEIFDNTYHIITLV